MFTTLMGLIWNISCSLDRNSFLWLYLHIFGMFAGSIMQVCCTGSSVWVLTRLASQTHLIQILVESTVAYEHLQLYVRNVLMAFSEEDEDDDEEGSTADAKVRLIWKGGQLPCQSPY